MDKVVSAIYCQYSIVIITEKGKIYQLKISELDNRANLQLLTKIPLEVN